MKKYIKPEIEVIALMCESHLAAGSTEIDPNNTGGDINGGSTDSGQNPLDIKENKSSWDEWDEGSVWE